MSKKLVETEKKYMARFVPHEGVKYKGFMISY